MTLLMRLLVFAIPFFVMAFLVIQRTNLSTLEVALLLCLSVLIPWLVLELLQRLLYQKSAQNAFIKFYDALESMMRRLGTLEQDMKDKKDTSHDSEQDVTSELRVLRGLVEQIAAAQQTDNPHEEVVEAEVIEMENLATKQTSAPETKRMNLTREELLKLVEGAVKKNRIEMLMQCIVSLPQRKTRHFECFSRLLSEDGTIINPDNFLNIAEEKNLMRVVDNALLFRCIQMIRSVIKKHFDVLFFLNMAQTSLSDYFFISSLLDFLETNREVSKHLVVELSATTFRKLTDPQRNTLKRLKQMDVTFSVDQIEDLDWDMAKLRVLGVRYLKLQAPFMLKIAKDPQGMGKLNQFKLLSDQSNMDLILSHVETEDMMRELSDYHFDYGQGYLFGTPNLSKQY